MLLRKMIKPAKIISHNQRISNENHQPGLITQYSKLAQFISDR